MATASATEAFDSLISAAKAASEMARATFVDRPSDSERAARALQVATEALRAAKELNPEAFSNMEMRMPRTEQPLLTDDVQRLNG